MNALLNMAIGLIVTAVIYFGMTGPGKTSNELALSTALLVAATAILPTLRSDQLAEKMRRRRRQSFEQRLEVSRDHVKLVVKECLEEVLPEIEKHRPVRRWRP